MKKPPGTICFAALVLAGIGQLWAIPPLASETGSASSPAFLDDRACGTEPGDVDPLLPRLRSSATAVPGPLGYRVRPIFYNPENSHRFRIEIMPSPQGLQRVEIFLRNAAVGSAEEPLEINDEGRSADRKAQDGIWSAVYESRAGEQPVFRYVVHTDPPQSGYAWVTPVPVIARYGLPDPIRLSNRAQYTDSLLNLKNRKLLKKKFRQVQRSGNSWYGFTRQQMAGIYEVVADEFGDRFDFLAVVNAGTRVTHSNRYYSGLYNDTEGIGVSRYDFRAQLGSNSLQGTVTYPVPSLFPGGMTVVHEIGHRWIVFLPAPFGSPGGAHWPRGTAGACSIMGINGSGGQGLLFPFKITKKGSGYRVQKDCSCNSETFKRVELYLMGLRGRDESGDEVFNFDDQTQTLPGPGCGDSVTWHGPVSRFDSSSIAQQLGERLPGESDSQREFQVLGVLVSDRLLSKKAMVYLSELWKADADLFRAATRGTGRLLVQLD